MGAPISKVCSKCHRPFTEEEYNAKVKAKIDNAAASRAKAIANGNRMGRKPRLDQADIKWLRDLKRDGKSYRQIAKLTSLSTSTIQRYVKEINPQIFSHHVECHWKNCPGDCFERYGK